MVWSESEIFLPYLQDIQEYLASSREKTVTDILDRVKSDCCKVNQKYWQYWKPLSFYK